ncbi:MAG: hypothetical protein OEY24_04625 [Candidatus Bathyarchaeota archaeon]|nr:hypothetical protein [Candidatus Bathyarchaeota archaeon]MDH5494965.1 hypothetical protein [Candidatus Bathyarchaeota archaeon]
MIQEYQKKRKEKEAIKKELADSLQVEIKEYKTVTDEMANFVEKLMAIAESVDKQPTPGQLIQFIDIGSQIPRMLAKLIAIFIHLARACKDISKQKGFMKSLLTTNRFMHDFVERMGEAYIMKGTVKIDSSFFRFFFMYKQKILKNTEIHKLSKAEKKEIELLKKKVETILRGLNQRFIERHLRKVPVKKWKSSLRQLNKVTKSMTIDTEGMDISGLEDFMPPGLKEVAPFLDKSPP